MTSHRCALSTHNFTWFTSLLMVEVYKITDCCFFDSTLWIKLCLNNNHNYILSHSLFWCWCATSRNVESSQRKQKRKSAQEIHQKKLPRKKRLKLLDSNGDQCELYWNQIHTIEKSLRRICTKQSFMPEAIFLDIFLLPICQSVHQSLSPFLTLFKQLVSISNSLITQNVKMYATSCLEARAEMISWKKLVRLCKYLKSLRPETTQTAQHEEKLEFS